jgi:LacI family transcriptional regulator
MKRKSVTMDDVAARAKVSRQTVSRVLHSNDYVSERTREKVEKAISDLGFFPDPVARSLAYNRTYLVAVVVTEFTGYTRASVLVGAEEEARRQGYNVFICGSEVGELGEPLHSPLLNSQRAEGVLILYRGSSKDHHRLFQSVRPDLPIVTIGYAPRNPGVTRILVDNRRGAYQAVMHLLECGHRRIAQVSGPKGRYDADERTQGYRKALRQAGVRPDEELIRYGNWTPDSGYEQMRGLLEEGISFSAVFAHSDLMALGCMQALKDRGLKIPEDVGVVGFDDISITQFVDPPLTSVHQPFLAMGQAAMRELIDSIDGRKQAGSKVVLPTNLVIRRSSCATD